jgi:anti-sigma B factor antagonist
MTQPDPANILPLEGEIDLHVAPRLESSLARITKKRPPHVVVDLSGVTFIDSSGLAVLIRAREDVRNYGGKLILSGIKEDVLVIFEMARLDQVFLINQRKDELLAAD